MNVVRKIASWISLYLVAGLFFLTAGSYALFNIVAEDNIKQTVAKERTYNKVVPAVLSSATYSQNITQGQQLPLNEPWVKNAATDAFPASDLRQKGEVVIDSVFTWLDGETDQPQYRLDFTANKQKLAEEIGKGTEARLNSLPRCGPNNIPESIDAFSINCLPFGISAKAIADRTATQVLNDQGFLKDPVVASGELAEASQGTVKDNPFEQLEGFRSSYQKKGLLLWLLPVLTVLFAALGVFLARDRLKALKRLRRSFISSGVGLAIFALLIGFGFERAVRAVSRDAITRDIASPVLINLAHQFRNIYLVFAVMAFVIALGLVVTRRSLLKRQQGIRVR